MRIGYDVRRVDLHDSRNKADTLARIAAALDFPEWFGHNWDALADCLGDLPWLTPGARCLLVFEGCKGHAEAWPVLIEILQQSCTDWAEREVLLSCVLAFDGDEQ
ncbi:MAG: barstar family protein [Pseudazoarcus pumilus]|nr:barstar family protein [Pseudazoarcus pumilus]